jgi:micrococcal nuclease
MGIPGLQWVVGLVAEAAGPRTSFLRRWPARDSWLLGAAPSTSGASPLRLPGLTGDLAFGKDVKVLVRDVDRYGRTVGEVILPDGRSLNRELVKAGLAWWYRHYAAHDRELERLEADARAARRGLWTDPHPIPPWEWRKEARAGALR